MEEHNTQTQTNGAGDRTFTQDDVNRIVQERLAKEKERSAGDLLQRESELQARELRITAREKLAEKGLPADLLDALNYTSADALEKSITLIKGCMDKNSAAAPKGATGMRQFGKCVGEYDSLRKAMQLE